MPLIRHRELASWGRLEYEGINIADPKAEQVTAYPELHIGFLNMMPDRALKATERQFFRLIAAGADHHSVYIHPFTIGGLDRSAETLRYVAQVYDSFSKIKQLELDGLVLTGANPGVAEITAERYWPYFEEVTHWAATSVPSVFCSCLASHAILKLLYGIERTRCKPDKRWGVFEHRVVRTQHPLMADMPSHYDEPRSHVFEMTASQLEPIGIDILASSETADFGIAASKDGIKWVFLQGHPEYDAISLLKEYKREINRYQLQERSDYPDFPLNYLPQAARQQLEHYRNEFIAALNRDFELPKFPEADIIPLIDSTWAPHAKVLFRNWLRQVAGNRTAG